MLVWHIFGLLKVHVFHHFQRDSQAQKIFKVKNRPIENVGLNGSVLSCYTFFWPSASLRMCSCQKKTPLQGVVLLMLLLAIQTIYCVMLLFLSTAPNAQLNASYLQNLLTDVLKRQSPKDTRQLHFFWIGED